MVGGAGSGTTVAPSGGVVGAAVSISGLVALVPAGWGAPNSVELPSPGF